jgi:two-component system nitrogen regulation response regulator NtrX
MHIGDSIDKQALAALINRKTEQDIPSGATALPEKILEKNYNDAKEMFEKHYLEFQFSRNNGIISKTAAAIGIYPSNLHAKLRKYGIAAQTIKEEP